MFRIDLNYPEKKGKIDDDKEKKKIKRLATAGNLYIVRVGRYKGVCIMFFKYIKLKIWFGKLPGIRHAKSNYYFR